MSFTKGPWHYESDGYGTPKKRSDQYVVDGERLGRIATCHWTDDGEAFGNAHLISAAPQLLASLIDLTVMCDQYLLDPRRTLDEAQFKVAVKEARETIAKAVNK